MDGWAGRGGGQGSEPLGGTLFGLGLFVLRNQKKEDQKNKRDQKKPPAICKQPPTISNPPLISNLLKFSGKQPFLSNSHS